MPERLERRLVGTAEIKSSSGRRRITSEWTLADLAQVRHSHRLVGHGDLVQHVVHLLPVLLLHSLKHLILWAAFLRRSCSTVSTEGTKLRRLKSAEMMLAHV